MRYRLLEPLREYAAERLAAEGRRRGAPAPAPRSLRGLAEAGRRRPAGPGQTAWLARLDTEHPNLRAALTWCAGPVPADGAAPARGRRARPAPGGRPGLVLAARGHLGEGRRWLEAALAPAAGQTSPAPPALRARATFWLGLLTWHGGDLRTGRARIEASVAQLGALAEPARLGFALSHLGQLVLAQGDAPGGAPPVPGGRRAPAPAADDWALGVA